MDRMNPPPNYYGAMYPPNGNAQMNSPFSPNGNGVVSPPIYNEETPDTIKVNASMPQNEENNDGYLSISYGVNGVKRFYEEFKKLISENIGTRVKVYCAFTDSSLWHDKIFEGTLVSAADDHLIVKEADTGKYSIIVSVYVIFIELFEK